MSDGSPMKYVLGAVEMRPIPSCPGYYATADGEVYTARFKDGYFYRMRLQVRRKGYKFVGVINTERKHAPRGVHHLVLEAFGFKPPRKLRGPFRPEVRHLNRNPSDNSISNLKWGTNLENHQDKVGHSTSGRGEQHYYTVLTDEKVLAARKERAEKGTPWAHLARKYGASQNCIYRAVVGQTWRHLPGTPEVKPTKQLTPETLEELLSRTSEKATTLAAEYGLDPAYVCLLRRRQRKTIAEKV